MLILLCAFTDNVFRYFLLLLIYHDLQSSQDFRQDDRYLCRPSAMDKSLPNSDVKERNR